MTTNTKLTLQQVKEQLATIGITISKRGDQYRVNFHHSCDRPGLASEANAYYTDNLEDALATGHSMAQYREESKVVTDITKLGYTWEGIERQAERLDVTPQQLAKDLIADFESHLMNVAIPPSSPSTPTPTPTVTEIQLSDSQRQEIANVLFLYPTTRALAVIFEAAKFVVIRK